MYTSLYRSVQCCGCMYFLKLLYEYHLGSPSQVFFFFFFERERERDYGASRSTKPDVLRVHIFNLKVQIVDPNR
jgi:hypothetical protein